MCSARLRKGATLRLLRAFCFSLVAHPLTSEKQNFSDKFVSTSAQFVKLLETNSLEKRKNLKKITEFLQLCDHKTCHMCSYPGRNGFLPDKRGSCEITQLISRPKVLKSHCVISQEPFLCSVKTLSSFICSFHKMSKK